jgi:AcrR family transcriptional regulator
VEAAYHVIAAHGFEGLRTRAVAARTRVNIATLHYYFPSKAALVHAVTEYLTEQFRTVHAPGGRPAVDPRQRLRQEFDDAFYYQAARRDLVAVMLELMLRAQREPATQRVLARALRKTGGRSCAASSPPESATAHCAGSSIPASRP